MTRLKTKKLLRRCLDDLGRLVQSLDFVIFPECQALLQDRLDPFGDGHGAMMLSRPDSLNVVLWQPCSATFTEVISAAIAMQKIFP